MCVFGGYKRSFSAAPDILPPQPRNFKKKLAKLNEEAEIGGGLKRIENQVSFF